MVALCIVLWRHLLLSSTVRCWCSVLELWWSPSCPSPACVLYLPWFCCASLTLGIEAPSQRLPLLVRQVCVICSLECSAGELSWLLRYPPTPGCPHKFLTHGEEKKMTSCPASVGCMSRSQNWTAFLAASRCDLIRSHCWPRTLSNGILPLLPPLVSSVCPSTISFARCPASCMCMRTSLARLPSCVNTSSTSCRETLRFATTFFSSLSTFLVTCVFSSSRTSLMRRISLWLWWESTAAHSPQMRTWHVPQKYSRQRSKWLKFENEFPP